MSERISLYDDDIGEVLYIDHMGTDKRIVDAARVSFGRDLITEDFSDRDKKLLKFLMREKHTSPFEHCSLTSALEGSAFRSSPDHAA
jgi:thymidylate synthase (FAD)